MSQLLDRAAILRFLEEVAAELPVGAAEEVVVVGGSMLALTDLRSGTRDVDAAGELSQQLRGAAAVVAERHDLAPGWLSSSASAFVPYGYVDVVDPSPVLSATTLTVFTATADAVFVMKLFAGRPQDHDDLVALWPLCRFASPQAAADACNRAYDFIGQPDVHLARYVEQIAAEAG